MCFGGPLFGEFDPPSIFDFILTKNTFLCSLLKMIPSYHLNYYSFRKYFSFYINNNFISKMPFLVGIKIVSKVLNEVVYKIG